MEVTLGTRDQNVRSPTPNDLSAFELRKLVRSELRKSGAVNALTAQFRHFVIDNLVAPRESKTCSQVIHLQDILLQSIIVDFLKKHGMVHTMAVFVPESNIQERILSQDDIFRLMQMNSDSSVTQAQTNDGTTCVLLTLVSMATKTKVTTISTQTNECNIARNARCDLNLELSKSHAKYDQALKQNLFNSSKNMEEIMRTFQLECNARHKQESERNLHRFKENLLHVMQQQESNKYLKELQSMREKLKADFDSRVQKSLNDAQHLHHIEIKKLKNVIKADNKEKYEIMKDFEISKHQHLEERRIFQIRKKALDAEEKRINNLLQQAHSKLEDVENKESDLKQKAALEHDRVRKQAKLAYDDATHALFTQRDCYIEEMKNFQAERDSIAKHQFKISSKQKELIECEEQNFTLKRERDTLHTSLHNLETKCRQFHSHFYPDEEMSSIDNFDLKATLIKYKKIIEDKKALIDKLSNLENILQLKNNEIMEQKQKFEAALSSLKDEVNQTKEESKKIQTRLQEAVLKEESGNAELTDMKMLLQKSQDMLETMKLDSQSLLTKKNNDIFLSTDSEIKSRMMASEVLSKTMNKMGFVTEIVDKPKKIAIDLDISKDVTKYLKKQEVESLLEISCGNMLNTKKDIVNLKALMIPKQDLYCANEIQFIVSEVIAEESRLVAKDKLVKEAVESSEAAANKAEKERLTTEAAIKERLGIQNIEIAMEADKKVEVGRPTVKQVVEETFVETPMTIEEESLTTAEDEEETMSNEAFRSGVEGRLAAKVTSKTESEVLSVEISNKSEEERGKRKAYEENSVADISKKTEDNHNVAVEAVKKIEEERLFIQAGEKMKEEILASDKVDVSKKAREEVLANKANEEDLVAKAAEKVKQEKSLVHSSEKAKEERLAAEKFDVSKKAEEEKLYRKAYEEDLVAEVTGEEERLALQATGNVEKERGIAEASSKVDEKRINILGDEEDRSANESTKISQKKKVEVERTLEEDRSATKNLYNLKKPSAVQHKNCNSSPSENAKISAAIIIQRAIIKKMKTNAAFHFKDVNSSYETEIEILDTSRKLEETSTNSTNSTNSSLNSTDYSSDFPCSSDEIEVGSHGSYNDTSWSNKWGF